MNKFLGLLLLAFSFSAMAENARYYPEANSLYVPSVKVGNMRYGGVTLRVDHFSNVAVSGSSAGDATFDSANMRLSLPAVQVGTTNYYGVTLRLDSFSVVSVTSAINEGAGKCYATNGSLTLAKYNQITLGMSYDAVQSLLGCAPFAESPLTTGAVRTWHHEDDGASIWISFNTAGQVSGPMAQFPTASMKGQFGLH